MEDGRSLGRGVDPLMGGELTRRHQTEGGAVVEGDRVDAAAQGIEAGGGRRDEDIVAMATGDIAEEGVDKMAFDGIGAEADHLRFDDRGIKQGAGVESQSLSMRCREGIGAEGGKDLRFFRKEKAGRQDIEEIFDIEGVPKGGGIDIGLLDRQGTARADDAAVEEDPFATAEGGGDAFGSEGAAQQGDFMEKGAGFAVARHDGCCLRRPA